jgi:tRNA-(ms[2]io[6]A)-hydroxylase
MAVLTGLVLNAGLKLDSPDEWLETVLANFDEFLVDHAANERKASAAALSMVAHYPDKVALVETMVDLALEELNHYRQVLDLMRQRNLNPGRDEKDVYVNQIIKHIRRGTDHYFLDRLLSAGIIEARGAERFDLIGAALDDVDLKRFYKALARSEHNHHELFVTLAETYFSKNEVDDRWQEWLQIEANILGSLAIRPRLH